MQISLLASEKQSVQPTKQQAGANSGKKKLGLLKKKKLPQTKLFSNIDIKHVVNISDLCFVNQYSLRNPDDSDQSILKTLYHYKMISKVTLNTFYANIQLKKCEDNYLPPQYFFERLRSFGDQRMANIANHLEKIHLQFSAIKQLCPLQQSAFSQKKQEKILQTFLHSMEGKKYFLYYSEITPQKINLRNVIFSIPLLVALGCNIKNIAMDFLKYRHVFFDVFTTKFYASFMQRCLDNFSNIQNQMMKNPNISEQQKSHFCSFEYQDEVIRKKQTANGIYQEINLATVRWFSPHPSICCFQILQIKEDQGVRQSKNKKRVNFQECEPQEQIEALRKIGIVSPLLQIG